MAIRDETANYQPLNLGDLKQTRRCADEDRIVVNGVCKRINCGTSRTAPLKLTTCCWCGVEFTKVCAGGGCGTPPRVVALVVGGMLTMIGAGGAGSVGRKCQSVLPPGQDRSTAPSCSI